VQRKVAALRGRFWMSILLQISNQKQVRLRDNFAGGSAVIDGSDPFYTAAC